MHANDAGRALRRAIALYRGAKAAIAVLLAAVAGAGHGHAAQGRLTQWADTVPQAWRETMLAAASWVGLHHAALVAALLAMALVHSVEAWGLWRGRSWAEWLTIVSSAVFVPFEVAAVVQHASIERVAVLAINGAVVAWLLRDALAQRAAASARE